MKILAVLIAVAAASPALAQPAYEMPGEEKVKPYEVSNANAGGTPMADAAVFDAFGGKDGIGRIVTRMTTLNKSDPRISQIFKKTDMVRLNRTLNAQFCYILGGGCAYTGRDMKTAHKDMGLQASDMNALVENLQKAMDEEGVPFAAQNKLLAKLAPQKRDMMER